ncbi:MAG: hypothetical protein H7Z38_02020 [Rubrivivax sp.]|nr:hypothetical protein [Pyrinomonadaceae bacterium]
MRYLKRWQLAMVCLVALILPPVIPIRRGQAQAVVTYTVTDLGTLGGTQSKAHGIDNCGRVVGESPTANSSGNPHPFFWSDGQLTDIEPFVGGSSGSAQALNGVGFAAGHASDAAGNTHPFIWSSANGQKTDLGTLSGGSIAVGNDINDSNQIVGVSETGTGGTLANLGFIWQPSTGTMQSIGAFPGGSTSVANGINNAGQVVGTAQVPSGKHHAFVLTDGTMLDLGTLENSGTSIAHKINDAGQVVGHSDLFFTGAGGPKRAFIWSPTLGMMNMGTLGGDSSAFDINNSGQAVGASDTATGVSHAFIYTQASGIMSDLNDSLAPGSNWTLSEARSINDRGQIVGFGINHDGKLHAFLLTPSNAGPSPCNLTPERGELQFTSPNYSVVEGGVAATITVTRTGGSQGDVSVSFATSNGTATAGQEYTSNSGTLNFADGDTEETFTVIINDPDDSLDEADKTINLTLSNPQGGGALGAQSTSVLRITDDDPPPSFSISDVILSEGNSGATAFTFTVTKTGATARATSVGFATANDTATTANGDYTPRSGTLNFAAGDAEKTITVFVNGDTTNESDETFFVNLSNASNATISDAQGMGTIQNDDTPSPGTLQFSLESYSVDEGDGTATINVTRTGGNNGAVSADFATSNGTATANPNDDYTATSGTLNFADGEETRKTFTVSITNDTLDEPNETVNLALTNPTGGATLGAQSAATLAINDDDAEPTLQFSSATYNVGEGGGTATITVTRTGGSNAVSVSYNTPVGGNATAGSDYTATSGTLNFGEADPQKTFTVPILEDGDDEDNETVNLALSNPSGGATLGTPGAAVLTIIDNDDSPTFSINDVTQAEGNAGTSAFTFTVTKSGTTQLTTSVDFATANGTATTTDNDYVSNSGSFSFASNETTKTITVNVNGDTKFEADEDFFVNLSNPSGATITDAQGTGTITNTDTAPSFSIDDVTHNEGNTGTTSYTFTVTKTGTTAFSSSVDYATANDSAIAPSDYTAVPATTLTFLPGDTTKQFTVLVNGDLAFESNEQFFVNLSTPSGATITDAQGKGIISNDDVPGTLQFSAPTYSVGEANVTATITVTRTGGSDGAVAVNFATSDGTATPNPSGDYTTTSGTLNFANGDTEETFTVAITNDTLDEANETVNLTLSNPTNGASLGVQGTATLTINDDDAAPILQFSAPTYSVGEDSATATITVTRTGGSNAVSVGYATTLNGTATAASDYTETSGTLNFVAGDNEETFTVNINNDSVHEGPETVSLAISNATGGATLGAQSTAVLTITDNDGAPTLSIGDVTQAEGNAGTTAFTFTVTKTGATALSSSVNFATADGTAQDGTPASEDNDYTAINNGTVSFLAADTSKTITVFVTGDTTPEGNETFFVNLTSATNATIADNQGLGTISNDDASLSISDVTVIEGNSGIVNAHFNVSIPFATAGTVTVSFSTADNTATVAGGDYNATNGLLTFNPGDISKTVTVQVKGDATDETDETFFVNLSGATGATISDSQGQGTITDDDGTPSLSISDVTVTEGDGGTTNAVFTVTLLPTSGQTVSVNFATADNTATAGSDYNSANGQLSFAPGDMSKTITVIVNGDAINEADETFSVNLSFPNNAVIPDAQGIGTITNDDTPRLQFSQAVYAADESLHLKVINVTRTGDASLPVTVDYVTSDGTASQRNDYTFAFGTLRFAAGETSKSFELLLTDDAFLESAETINLTLSNPTGGAGLGVQSSATASIASNDNTPPGSNPINASELFVRMHYHDFFGRSPDQPGLGFWMNNIEGCGQSASCREVKRIDTSAAFYLSIEFQETGFLVERIYKTAFGDATGLSNFGPQHSLAVPIVRLDEFQPDTLRIGQGVVIGQPGADALLEANKNAFALEFVQRQRFLSAFPLTMTSEQFVDTMNLNTGGVLTQPQRNQLVQQLTNSTNVPAGRAGVLRQVAENAALKNNEKNRAFVLMQYFGYLRRNPNDAPDADYSGYDFWLQKLNGFGGDFRGAEMVKAFITSTEYRQRFGQP